MADTLHTVLLIHGTGAASDQSDGEKWWQRGSRFWQELHDRLCDHQVGCEEVFHWSGKNLESERRQAATALLVHHLGPMEEKKRDYHLIGHSHGGSVIWLALREAVKHKVALDHLKSWTTVGTPFFQYQDTLFARASRLILIVSSVLMPLAGAFLSLPMMVWPFLEMESVDFVEVALAAIPLVFLGGMGWGFWRLCKVTGAAYENRVSERTMATFGGRWLGVRSCEDEAINGLKYTLVLQGNVVPRFSSFILWWEQMWSMFIYLSRTFSPLLRKRVVLWFLLRFVMVPYIALIVLAMVPFYLVYYFVLAPIYNYGLAGGIDRFIWGRVANGLQGKNVPLITLQRVMEGPIPADAGAYPPLPDEVTQSLVETADQHAKSLIPKIRKQLGLSALVGPALPHLITGVSAEFTWGELVHTSYFDNAHVVDLLLRHIETSLGNGRPEPSSPQVHRLDAWLKVFKDEVRCGILDRLPVDPLPAHAISKPLENDT